MSWALYKCPFILENEIKGEGMFVSIFVICYNETSYV